MEKIADACKEAQLPNPQFIKRSGGILVELSRTADELGNQICSNFFPMIFSS